MSLFEKKPLSERVREQRKLGESKAVKIIRYEPKYHSAFKALNEAWISKYFAMEHVDYQELNDPQGYILDKGGEILVALYQNEPLGVCALLKSADFEHEFELSKLAVSPKAQGKGIGKLLVRTMAELAKEKGGTKLFLQSNTVLTPAINLYYKMGFKKVSRPSPLFDRVNIQMELPLKP